MTLPTVADMQKEIDKLQSQLLASDIEKAGLVEAFLEINRFMLRLKTLDYQQLGHVNGIVSKALASAKPAYEARLKDINEQLEIIEKIEWGQDGLVIKRVKLLEARRNGLLAMEGMR